MHRCMALTTPDLRLSGRWDDVRVFLAALRRGSFTKAAAELGTDQSTVSRRIASLEEALGVQLFERTGRAPLPTEAAERLREHAADVESALGRFADEATGLGAQSVAGRVKLALTEELAVYFVVPHVIPQLRSAHPALTLELVTSYRSADLVGREADVALRFFQTERGDLVGRRIARFTTTIVGGRAYARRARGRGLGDLDWIAVELAGVATPESTWLEAHVRRPPALLCSSYQAQLAAIRAGLGVGVAPRALTKLDRGFVEVELSARPPMPRLDLHVVTRRAIRDVPRIRALIDALVVELAQFGD
jgi:DNA-binding transcriptional LysR family regulator